MNKADLKRSLEAELLKIERQDKKIYGVGETRYDLMIRDVLNYIDNSISKEVIEKKYQEAENEVIKIREENIKNNNATKYDYLKVGKRDAYKELLEGK